MKEANDIMTNDPLSYCDIFLFMILNPDLSETVWTELEKSTFRSLFLPSQKTFHFLSTESCLCKNVCVRLCRTFPPPLESHVLFEWPLCFFFNRDQLSLQFKASRCKTVYWVCLKKIKHLLKIKNKKWDLIESILPK